MTNEATLAGGRASLLKNTSEKLNANAVVHTNGWIFSFTTSEKTIFLLLRNSLSKIQHTAHVTSWAMARRKNLIGVLLGRKKGSTRHRRVLRCTLHGSWG